jgi:hypothetical protein
MSSEWNWLRIGLIGFFWGGGSVDPSGFCNIVVSKFYFSSLNANKKLKGI